MNCATTTKSDKNPVAPLKIDGPYVSYKDGYIESTSVLFRRSFDSIEIEKNVLDGLFPITTTCYIDTNLEKREDLFQYDILPAAENKIPELIYAAPARLIVVSDIEGNFYALKSILRGWDVIDENYNWIFGSNHIMILGDLTDRGINVLACLSLIYKLDHQSKARGGVVHYLLGNHELMNIAGDFRYVSSKYLFQSNTFDISFQPLFNSASIFSHWVKTKNTVELIGDTLFVHGGISAQQVNNRFSLEEINTCIRKYINSNSHTISNRERLLIEDTGPLWYREYVTETGMSPKVSESEVDRVLKYYNVQRMVIGHSTVPDISTFFHDKVTAIDVLQPDHDKETPVRALLIEDDKHFEVDSRGNMRQLLN